MATALTPSTLDDSPVDCGSDLFFFPGMYAPSGFDLMKILYCVATRPDPTIDLGPVDCSCPIVLCDLCLPDQPIVYASPAFLELTGYTLDEVLGRNCRFLQWPAYQAEPAAAPRVLPPALPSPYVPPSIRKALRESVKHGREVQVEVTNFRKDGTAFVNVLSVVPVHWADAEMGAGGAVPAAGGSGTRHRYSVGFLCDKEARA